MRLKPLIQKFLYPKKHVWTKSPVGFIVHASVPIGQIHWYVNDVEILGSQQTFDYEFPKAETYQIKVMVYDGEGGYDEKQVSVVVDDQPKCDVDCYIDQSKSAITINEYDKKIKFTIDISVFGDKIESVYWNWSDGTTLDAPNESAILKKEALHPMHNYTAEGEHYGSVKISTVSVSCVRNFFVIVG